MRSTEQRKLGAVSKLEKDQDVWVATADAQGTWLAVKRDGVENALVAAGAGEGTLARKTLIDCNNTVDTDGGTFLPTTPLGTSQAEQISEAAPGSNVVKAFLSCRVPKEARG